MKKLLFFITLLMTCLFSNFQISAQTISAKDQCTKLGRGVNILGYDKAFWQDHEKGRFKESYFKMIHDAGFSTVRINLNPFSQMDSQNKINPQWLETLDWVISKGLEENLMTYSTCTNTRLIRNPGSSLS
jgi:endoglucanase